MGLDIYLKAVVGTKAERRNIKEYVVRYNEITGNEYKKPVSAWLCVFNGTDFVIPKKFTHKINDDGEGAYIHSSSGESMSGPCFFGLDISDNFRMTDECATDELEIYNESRALIEQKAHMTEIFKEIGIDRQPALHVFAYYCY